MAEIPRRTVDFVFAKGIDQSIEARVLPEDRLSVLINGEFDKSGTVNKRGGFTKVPATPNVLPLGGSWDTEAVRGAAFEDERILMSFDHLWSYSTNTNTTEQGWINKGKISSTQVARKSIARHPQVSLMQPDVDETNGYRCYAWSRPIIQVGLTAFVSTAGNSVSNIIPFDPNNGDFTPLDDDEALNGLELLQNNIIECDLVDDTTSMDVWCKEPVATYASDPKVVAPNLDGQNNIIITWIRHIVVFQIATNGNGDYSATFNGTTATYFSAFGESKDAIATGFAAAIDALTGIAASADIAGAENLISVFFTVAIMEITDVEADTGTIIGPMMNGPGTLHASLIDTSTLSSKVQDKSGTIAPPVTSSLYDAYPDDSTDNFYAAFNGAADNLTIAKYTNALSLTASIVVGAEAPKDVLTIYADTSDDIVTVGYKKGNDFRIRVMPSDLSGAGSTDDTSFPTNSDFWQASIQRFGGSHCAICVEIIDVANGNYVSWRQINNSDGTSDGNQQKTYNVRMGSKVMASGTKLFVNVLHACSNDLGTADI